jgi:hypothetical protein
MVRFWPIFAGSKRPLLADSSPKKDHHHQHSKSPALNLQAGLSAAYKTTG